MKENMSSPKNNNNPPVLELSDMEFYNLADTTFKIAVFRKLSELQETDRK